MLQQGGKGKVVLEPIENGETIKRVSKNRARTKELKKALKEEKGHTLLDENLDMEDIIALDINEDREYLLSKVNYHL